MQLTQGQYISYSTLAWCRPITMNIKSAFVPNAWRRTSVKVFLRIWAVFIKSLSISSWGRSKKTAKCLLEMLIFCSQIHEVTKVYSLSSDRVQINECSPQQCSIYIVYLLFDLSTWKIHVKIKPQEAEKSSWLVPIKSTSNMISHSRCLGCIIFPEILSWFKKEKKT